MEGVVLKIYNSTLGQSAGRSCPMYIWGTPALWAEQQQAAGR